MLYSVNSMYFMNAMTCKTWRINTAYNDFMCSVSTLMNHTRNALFARLLGAKRLCLFLRGAASGTPAAASYLRFLLIQLALAAEPSRVET
jgi:hypothetical protein